MNNPSIRAQVSEIEIAFIAGFFDGEGCISIGKNGSVDIGIVNTSKINLEYIYKIFGGSLNKRSQKINKTQYIYRLYGENAINFLTVMEPYLLDKKEQAHTIAEYFKLRNEISTIRIPGKKGAFANPDREVLVSTFREILSEQKKEEH